MKFPSRNRKPSNITKIVCPYCKHYYPIEEETEDDYYQIKSIKIHWCRKCGMEFVNGVTKDITYVYS